MLTKLYVRTRNFFECDEGATAVEYGLMVALIAVVIIGAVMALGGQLKTVFNDVAGYLNGVASGTGS
jgi:pilus assembly protein Flp/PilA